MSNVVATRIVGQGLVDSSKELRFDWNGKSLTGYAGDTLASALLVNNERVLARSFKYHRARGIMSAGVEESGALVTVGEGARRDANVKATTQELFSGLVASGQNAWPSVNHDLGAVSNLFGRFFAAGFYYKTFMGIPPLEWGRGTAMWMRYEKLIRRAAGMGKASREPDPDNYEQAHAHCDLLIVGSGPAGRAAALKAANEGLDVWLVEQDFRFGGDTLNCSLEGAAESAARALAYDLAALESVGVTLMRRTTAFGLYDNLVAGLYERVTDHMNVADAALNNLPRHRCWTLRCKGILLATGALERGFAFDDNDRPGVMTASSARTYLNRYGVLAGQSIVVSTNNDSAYTVAAGLASVGAHVRLLDARPKVSVEQLQLIDAAGIEHRMNSAALQAVGSKGVRRVEIAQLQAKRWQAAGSFDADTLLVSGGWSPVINLQSHRGVKPVWSETTACFLPGASDSAENIQVAGAAAGYFSTEHCIADALRAIDEIMQSMAGAQSQGHGDAAVSPAAVLHATAAQAGETALMPLYEVALSSTKSTAKRFVDFQHDVTSDDIRLAHREGFVSVEHMKRYTTLGMATDQGKMGNIIGLALMAEAQNKSIEAVGVTTFRPPYTPVSLGALRGRSAAHHFRALRRTPLDTWNLQQGATMMDAGLWRRPWYFAQDNESLVDTATRETLCTRSKVGLCDVTSLGKISVCGPDAMAFLERVYCNNFASLAVGKTRYGIMLRDDGIVLDDGTCWRLGEHEFFMTTTTAKAGHVMVWLEELLQVRWPQLKVHVSSVTDQWAGIAVAGPLSRRLLKQQLADPEGLSNENLPFMGVLESILANDVPCRIARISFSGELAYEIYVPADFSEQVMQDLWSGADALGGCLYGIEALGTMRIEKGHVTGAELDGRVTLADAGLGKMASSKKPYIGGALAARPQLQNPNRPRLVGIVPVDENETFNSGSILCLEDKIEGFGEGWVTGVAHSPSMGHWIGIGFVTGGAEHWQDKILVAADPVRNASVRVKMVSPHMYDPSGSRLHA